MTENHLAAGIRSAAARVALILARWRIRLWLFLTRRFLGRLSGPIPIVGMVYSLDDAALSGRDLPHVRQRVLIAPAEVLAYDFPAHFPPAFRRVHAFPEKKLFVLHDVCVGPRTGAVWQPSMRGLAQESVGALERLLLWPDILLERLQPPDPASIPGMVVACPPGLYYHWLLETVPNLIHALAHAPDARVLVTPHAPQYVRDSLSLLLGADGLEQRLHVCTGPVRVEHLLLAQVEPEPRFVRPAEVRAIVAALCARVALPAGPPTLRLYVSRRHSPRRRVDNEGEVEARLADIGFQIVYSEQLTLPEQIRLFAAAQVIVGLHGAGLSNLIWARPPCRILELFPSYRYNPSYAYLATALGFTYDCHWCEPGVTPYGAIPVDAVIRQLTSHS